MENEQRGGNALACLVIEVVAEEWCAAFYDWLVERTAQLCEELCLQKGGAVPSLRSETYCQKEFSGL